MRSDLPPLKTLPVFRVVAKYLSFSKAAEELSLTHSAVSQAIKQLELYLGCKLFERTTTHVALTKAGQLYLADITSSLDQISNATAHVRRDTKWININLMNTLALHWLIPNLPKFQNKQKELKVNLSTSATPSLSSLDQRDIDIIIAYQSMPENNAQYFCMKLFDDELVLVGSTNVLKNNKNDSQLLLKQHAAIYVDAPLRKKDWQIWCIDNNIKEPAKKSRYSFPSTSQAIQAAISGTGLLVTHRAFIADSLNYKLLKIVAENQKVKTKNSYYAIALSERAEEEKIKDCMKFLKSIAL